MALFSQYAVAAADQALEDAGLLGNMENVDMDMAVGIPFSIVREFKIQGQGVLMKGFMSGSLYRFRNW